VQAIFKRIFNPEPSFATDGSQFDHLFADGEAFPIGKLAARALHTPGHTPADLTYLVGDAAFVGDTLFMPDYGTARADFPGGDAGLLYRSIRRILELPADTRLFTCHDYKAAGRDRYAWESTVGEQRAKNIHVHDGIGEADFVTMRKCARRNARHAHAHPAVRAGEHACRPSAAAGSERHLLSEGPGQRVVTARHPHHS